MATGQWLFAPAQPLVERLGKQFFREVPSQPGVYLMRDATGQVLYVGKAKNLRRRLGSYRVPNSERMPRRHLRLVRQVARIDFELCANESAALAHEAKLLRRFKPKFNRAGVWPGKAQFLTWRFTDHALHFGLDEIPPVGWERFGSLGGYARYLHGTVVRLLWLALNPQAGFSRLPYGWAHHRFALPVTIACGRREPEVRRVLDQLFWGQPKESVTWLRASTEAHLSVFEQAAILVDLEEVESFVARYRVGRADSSGQLALL